MRYIMKARQLKLRYHMVQAYGNKPLFVNVERTKPRVAMRQCALEQVDISLFKKSKESG